MGCLFSKGKDQGVCMNVNQNENNAENDKKIYKLILIGDSYVGKTRFLGCIENPDAECSPHFISTVGIDLKLKKEKVNGQDITFQIWDTGGQERFRSITTSYYRKADGAFILYDISDKQSFEALNRWLVDLKRTNDKVEKILIGNKSDLYDRKVSYMQGKMFADDNGMEFFETSAKEKINVAESYEKLKKMILSKRQGVSANKPKNHLK